MSPFSNIDAKVVTKDDSSSVTHYETLKSQLEKDLVRLKAQSYSVRNPFRNRLSEGSIEDKITESHESIKKKLENESFAQDIKLKRQTLNRLFWFLTIETVVVFIFAMWQGFNTWGFYLEEWSFRLLIAATITQITTMLLVAVRHLFPQKK